MNVILIGVACLMFVGAAVPALAGDADASPDVTADAAAIDWTGSGLLTAAAATAEHFPSETGGPPAIPGNPVHPIVPGNPVKIILPGFGKLTASPAE